MKKTGNLHILLEYNHNTLFEITDPGSLNEITIGRSSRCTWQLPSDDHLASGKHALLEFSNGKVYISDLGSRNGVFFRGEKITRRAVSAKDEYLIGNCVLKIREANEKKAEPSSLVIQNSGQKGQRFFLVNEKIRIGNAPDSDLVLSDPLISSCHAIITRNGRECWLQDNASSNGTAVNNMPLKGKNQRLLKDGDIISLAYIDLKFQDGAVEHSPVRIIKTIVVLAVTLIAALSAYWVYQHLSRRSDEYLSMAQKAAEKELFDLAYAHITKAKTCSNANRYRNQIENMSSSLDLWRNTVELWAKGKSLLSEGKWVEASHILGRLESGGLESWGWNATSAIEMRNQMLTAKKLLDYYFSGLNMLNTYTSASTVPAYNSDLTKAQIEEISKSPPPYLHKLVAEVKKVKNQEEHNKRQTDQLIKILSMLEVDTDNFSMIISRLHQLQEQGIGGYIKTRIQKCLVPLTVLQKSTKQLRLQVMLVCNMEFDKALKLPFELPSIEQCSAEPHLSNFRKRIEKQQKIVSNAAIQLKVLTKNLTPNQLSDSLFLDLNTSSIMKKVFMCDSLQYPLPVRGRNHPSGEYDRILGIEIFYDFLTALPEPNDLEEDDSVAFTPEIVRIKKQLIELQRFINYLEIPSTKWLQQGKLRNLHRRGKLILKQRDILIGNLLKYTGDPRSEIISWGIALFLSANNSYPQKIIDSIALKMKELKNAMLPLNQAYNDASSERQIEIRDKILSIGLPGDPFVRRMWSFKPR